MLTTFHLFAPIPKFTQMKFAHGTAFEFYAGISRADENRGKKNMKDGGWRQRLLSSASKEESRRVIHNTR